MNDLDTRLERLAAEATRDVVPPELEAVARRGRRRRRRQLAGSALLVAAVVAAGLVLPARLAGRPGPAPNAGAATAPVPDVADAARVGGYWFGKTDATVLLGGGATPATDVGSAAILGGYWFGKTDASVYLRLQVTPAQRDAIRERIRRLDVVDEVYFESREEAYLRLKELYRTKPRVVANTDRAVLPESFRVRLDTPEGFARLHRALCSQAPRKALGSAPCMDGVEVVIRDRALLERMLVPRPWATSSDVTVFLPLGTTDAQRQVIRARLEAIDGVAKVTYETPAEAYRRLPEKLRRDGADPGKVTPPYSPRTVPAAFHVTLDEPVRAGELHRALCGSRRTGACGGGLVVLEHPRR